MLLLALPVNSGASAGIMMVGGLNMTKRQAMVEALAMLSGEAEAMSGNNLGMEPGPERKVQNALKRLAEELQKRCHRMSANANGDSQSPRENHECKRKR
jgi:hypothetical protein